MSVARRETGVGGESEVYLKQLFLSSGWIHDLPTYAGVMSSPYTAVEHRLDRADVGRVRPRPVRGNSGDASRPCRPRPTPAGSVEGLVEQRLRYAGRPEFSCRVSTGHRVYIMSAGLTTGDSPTTGTASRRFKRFGAIQMFGATCAEHFSQNGM